MSNATNMFFADRHAPKTFADLVFQDPNAHQRLALYASGDLHNSLILHGPYGTAKSTTALTIVADRRLRAGCSGSYVHHLCAGDLGNSLKLVLNSVAIMLATEPDPFPYVIVDEIDQLSKQAQLQLRHHLSTLKDLRLIMTTNDIARVDGGVQSRCDCIQLLPPSSSDWAPRVQAILASEGIHLPLANVVTLISGVTDIRSILRRLEVLVIKQGTQATSLSLGGFAPGMPAVSPINLPPFTLVAGKGLAKTSSANNSPPNITILPATPQTTGPKPPGTP